MVVEVILLIVGLAIGILIAYLFLRAQVMAKEQQIKKEMELNFEQWKIEFESIIRKDTQERMRAALKGRIGEQFAPLLPMFEYEPSDARFIGSPVDYVVFDGYKSGEPQKIVFVEVKTGKTSRLTSIERKFKTLVEDKNVEWKTIAIGEIGEKIGGIKDEDLDELIK